MSGNTNALSGGAAHSEASHTGPGRIEEAPRVCVLGPTTVDGEVVTRSQRAIVSTLALRPGDAFSAEQLMAAVWLEDVPASARSSLQNQLARLRRSFGDGLIETATLGYTLLGSTDVRAFEAAAASGCAPGVAPQDAVRQLSRAVALWGGPPFEALLEHPEADCEARRLVIMRQQVDESLAAARINSGDPDTAIVELEVLVTADPYRERRWELLMRALDAAGRSGEAVAAHERMSRRLGEDLGATPSQYMMGLRDLITDGSPLGPAMAGRGRAGRVSSTAGCGGPVPIRRRARCGDSYRTQRTWGGAE